MLCHIRVLASFLQKHTLSVGSLLLGTAGFHLDMGFQRLTPGFNTLGIPHALQQQDLFETAHLRPPVDAGDNAATVMKDLYYIIHITQNPNT